MSSNIRLTPSERLLLKANVDFYLSLYHGKRRPKTKDQHHFVKVCRGLQLPRTTHERAYLHFRALVRASGMSEQEIIDMGFVVEVREDEECSNDTPHGQQPPIDADYAIMHRPNRPNEIDEFGGGKPSGSWIGTEEDWQRMRNGYIYDSRD